MAASEVRAFYSGIGLRTGVAWALVAAAALAQTTSPLAFEFQPLGPAPTAHPTITNVQIVDLDRDGGADVLACDAQRQAVFAYRRQADGAWDEQVLADGLIAPAHATVVDLDRDGDNDVIVSVMGNLQPDDEVVGSLVLLQNDGGKFTPHTLLDDVRRVVDAQPGDFDADGDTDLAVAVFGYLRGQVLWLENQGGLQFRDHELLSAAGTIHVPVADYDRDGDLDIAAVVSQEDEQVWGFENLGGGKFSPRRLWMTVNFDIGSAGLVATDLDGDDDVDLLLPVGDNLEDSYAIPQPYHGCLWLENKGGWTFAATRIATFPGAYAAASGNLDLDGDSDVVLCSMVNDWQSPDAPSIVWLENDGDQHFTQHSIASNPIMLVTLACGDISGDGRPDVIAGGLHINPPFDRLGRVSSWITRKTAPAPQAERRTLSVTALPAEDDRNPPLPDLSTVDSLTRAELEATRAALAANVSAGTDSSAHWLKLGQAYDAYGFFAAAERCFAAAVERAPKDFLARHFHALSLQRLGRLPAAIVEFEAALPLAPFTQKPWAWHEIGRARLQLEDAAGAEAAFVAAGNYGPALLQLAKLRIALDRSPEAVAPLNALNGAQGGTVEGFLLNARVATATGQTGFAQQCRDHAEYNSKRFPDSVIETMLAKERKQYGGDRIVAEARSLIVDKQFAEAAELLRPVTAAEMRDDAVVLLAGCELNLKRPQATIELLEALQQSRGALPQAMQLLGDAYLANDQADRAIQAWEAALRVRTARSLHERLAKQHQSRGDDAAANHQRALGLESSGIAYLRRARPAQAEKQLEAAVAADPALPRAWFYLGECRRLLSNAATAREAYQKAIALAPNHGRALAALQLVE